MKILLLLASLAILTGCATTENKSSISVNEVLQKPSKFEGKIIQVHGWCSSETDSSMPYAISTDKNERNSNQRLLVTPNQPRDPYAKEFKDYALVSGRLTQMDLNATSIYALTEVTSVTRVEPDERGQ